MASGDHHYLLKLTLKSHLSYAPWKILNSTHTRPDFYFSSVLCFFLPLPSLSLYMECSSLFLHLGTVLQLPRSRSNKPRMFPEFCQPGVPEHPRPPFCSQHPVWCVYMPRRSSEQRPCLTHICIPLAQTSVLHKCLMND